MTAPGQPTLKPIRRKAEGLWDVIRRVSVQSAEDNVLFLAGGVAFNVLLALVPFVLLLVSGTSFLLGRHPDDAARTVTAIFDQLLPMDSTTGSDLLQKLVADVLSTRGAVTFYSAIGFAWFSTRLFGSLRSVLTQIFDGSDRSIVGGKLFDLVMTAAATVAVAVFVVFTFYLDMAVVHGARLLMQLGVRESAMSWLAYMLGRALALSFAVALFHISYRVLPQRRPSVRSALIGALTAGIVFEFIRSVYTIVVAMIGPDTLYTGTIAAVVSVVFWTYYGTLLFLFGAEVAQANQLRRLASLPKAGATGAAAAPKKK